MMAAILNSAILDSDTAILDSDTLLSSLRFTQKHSHSTLTWTNSIWLKLIHSPLIGDGNHLEFCHFVFSHLSFPSQTHSHLPRLVPTHLHKKTYTHSFWLNLMMAAILNSSILDSAILHKKTSLMHSHWTWWWQPSWILPCLIHTLPSCIQTPCYPLSRFTQKHSHFTLILPPTNSIWLTWWWQPSWILPSWIQPFCPKLWLKLIQSDSNTFILTQLDDGSHLEFYHVGFHHLYSAILVFPLKLTHACQDWFPPFAWKNFTHSFWINLMMAAILNSAILDSDTLLSSLRFTQ